jgi:hypothetical protein
MWAIAVASVASHEVALEGRAPGAARALPAVQAAFELESYAPGDQARLVIRDRSAKLKIRIFQSGPEHVATTSEAVMNGIPVTHARVLGRAPGKQQLFVPVGRWRSGLYFARLEAPDGRLGFAPFVVSPSHLGRHRIAVVLPTLTWQAYNFRDDDGDGYGDSWYVGKQPSFVRLGRAHLDRGVPFGFRSQLSFLNWLYRSHKQVDFLSQLDLERVESAEALARAYDLIVFGGHHEYVTTAEYDLVTGYRDLGGNLLFLSANNFFWRVQRVRDVIVKAGRWRGLGRPEASLIGVQYVANRPSPRGAWVVRSARARSWIFADTGLRPGSELARGGVEIDNIAPASPPQVQVVAEIPDLFGPGKTAQMTYYETNAGAKVFAAGAFHLTRRVTSDPIVRHVLENLWRKLARP